MAFMGTSPFPPLWISPGDQRQFVDLADQMLDRTLRTYDQFQSDQQHPHKKRWKKIRSEDNAVIFVKRGSSGEDSLSGAHVAWRGMKDPLVMVGIGHCDGCVQDMLLASGGRNVQQRIISAAYLGRRISDMAVLSLLKTPTIDDPFRLLLIQWIAYPPPPVLDRLAKTRDFVYLQSQGMMRRVNGDVIGYDMMQSVDLPGCPPLIKERSFVRGRLMLGSVFIQRPNNTVDVFFETFVEGNGKLSNKIAQYYTSSGLMSLFQLGLATRKLKLDWCIKMARRKRRLRSVPRNSTWSETNDCHYCQDRQTNTSIAPEPLCEICHSPMCSKCQRTAVIKQVSYELRVADEKVIVCTRCMERAETIRAMEIARHYIDREDQRDAEVKNDLDEDGDDCFQLTRSTDDSLGSLCWNQDDIGP